LLQVPVDALNVCPWVAVPLIAGRVVSTGLAGGEVTITDVEFDVAWEDPVPLVAVTSERTVCPTSRLLSV
jgi:hypothetical protein